MNIKFFKIKLAKEFGHLSELILRQQPAYEDIVSYERVGGHYYLNYLKYRHELKFGFSQKILENCIASAKWKFQISLLGKDAETLLPPYPEEMRQFKEWIKQKESKILTPIEPKDEEIATREIIKRRIKNRLPEFKQFKIKKDYYDFSYLLESNKEIHLVIIDNGFLNFHIGLEFINYQTDISTFFDGAQSCFPYRTEFELYQELNNALDIFDKLKMPVFYKVKKSWEFSEGND